MIELRHITKSYSTPFGPNVVLDDITVLIPTGQSLGILGQNGAGKSTLMRIIGGAEMPDSGTIVREGKVSWPIGFAGGFNGSLTGEDNCKFVARIYGQDVDRVIDETREFAEVGKYFYMPVRTYSSGMKARVAFGLSMAIDFDVYLVDEVTAVGDKRFREKCAAVFNERQAYSSMIMISHSMPTLRAQCTRGAVLTKSGFSVFDTIDEAISVYEEGLKR
ncbi:MAG: ABC transporter ATP-binding protein [Kofleriaceae bacterium]|nr:ABC transporter ATP-binding protein [Kofleriaceae bacterium]